MFVGVPRSTATEHRHGILVMLGVLASLKDGLRLPKATLARMLGVSRRAVQQWAHELHEQQLVDNARDGLRVGPQWDAWCAKARAEAKAAGGHWQLDALPAKVLHANSKAMEPATPSVLHAAAGIYQEARDRKTFVRGSRERAKTTGTCRKSVDRAIALLKNLELVDSKMIVRLVGAYRQRLQVVTASPGVLVPGLAVGHDRIRQWHRNAIDGARGANTGSQGGANTGCHPHPPKGGKASSPQANTEDATEAPLAGVMKQHPTALGIEFTPDGRALPRQPKVTTKGDQDQQVRQLVTELAGNPAKLNALDTAEDQEKVVEHLLALAGVYVLKLAKDQGALAHCRQVMARQLVFHAKDAAAALVWKFLLIATNSAKVVSIGAWVRKAVERSLRDGCRDAPHMTLVEVTRSTCSSKGRSTMPKQTDAMTMARQTKMEQFVFSWNAGKITTSVLDAMARVNLTSDDLAHFLGITREALEQGIAARMQRRTA